jgi:hypothetical protein
MTVPEAGTTGLLTTGCSAGVVAVGATAAGASVAGAVAGVGVCVAQADTSMAKRINAINSLAGKGFILIFFSFFIIFCVTAQEKVFGAESISSYRLSSSNSF